MSWQNMAAVALHLDTASVLASHPRETVISGSFFGVSKDRKESRCLRLTAGSTVESSSFSVEVHPKEYNLLFFLNMLAED
jgi:hypothetical protein